ncbi:MAG TPA: M1 family metallopeptidase [Acidimicrobiales bacterium]|nr:M1 family metallopeptidase [Acidimicrobiales bacterium]
MPDESQYRLPTNVVPVHYEVTLSPDLETCTYGGEERVQIEVGEAVREIVLNSLDLDIHSAELIAEDGRALAGTITLHPALERATIALDGEATPGSWTLHLAFSGHITDRLSGFYRSTFTDADGNEQLIATTQFEATDARRAFPCWDEPEFKASFGIRLIVAEDLFAVSNGPEVEVDDLGNGRRQITFADTMKMSTYLVAFVVGPLVVTDTVDVDGIPLRVACVPGKEHMTAFALEAGASALRFFAEWFAIPYPGEKLDMIALPDFAFGAMENLGCVTYRETALLVDTSIASRVELERIADVVCHEIAHMWFGDLVTMKWWNGIWLNEAFATFMEIMAVDDFKPGWERWVSFGVDKASAMLTDGLEATRPIEYPVVAPSDMEGMFDVLTYQKGGSVLRMLEQYLGHEAFRDGIRHYLKKHEYANAETSDLWDAIEEATKEPVRKTMDSWIFQGGHPIVSASLSDDRTSVELSQQRFRYLASPDDTTALWHVPVLLRIGLQDGTEERTKVLLSDASTAVQLPGAATYVVVNDGGSGFYRVRYSSEMLVSLTARYADLGTSERFNLVDDTWAAVLAGLSPVTDFLGLLNLLTDEADPNIWELVANTPLYHVYGRLSALDLIERAVGSDGRPAFQHYVQQLIRPAFDRLGWAPRSGETEHHTQLRGTLLKALGTVGADAEIRAQAAQEFDRWIADRESVDPEVVIAAVTILAWDGNEERYELYRKRMVEAATPQEELRLLLALASFPQRELVERTLQLGLTDEVRSQNTAFLFNALLANRSAGEQAWTFVKEHWDELVAKVPDNSHGRMLLGLPALVAPDLIADIKAFIEGHPVPAGHKTVTQAVEQLAVNVGFSEREATNLSKAFKPEA